MQAGTQCPDAVQPQCAAVPQAGNTAASQERTFERNICDLRSRLAGAQSLQQHTQPQVAASKRQVSTKLTCSTALQCISGTQACASSGCAAGATSLPTLRPKAQLCQLSSEDVSVP